eukprot:437507_1
MHHQTSHVNNQSCFRYKGTSSQIQSECKWYVSQIKSYVKDNPHVRSRDVWNWFKPIISVHYSKNMISNITLFKHNHQNETIKYYDNFSVMYLVEGYSFFDTEDWYSLMYENDNNYMIFLYYNT